MTATERKQRFTEARRMAKVDGLAAIDILAVGTPEYRGHAYYWAYAYRHYLRDCTRTQRRQVHAQLLRAGLPLSGESDAHFRIIENITVSTACKKCGTKHMSCMIVRGTCIKCSRV